MYSLEQYNDFLLMLKMNLIQNLSDDAVVYDSCISDKTVTLYLRDNTVPTIDVPIWCIDLFFKKPSLEKFHFLDLLKLYIPYNVPADAVVSYIKCFQYDCLIRFEYNSILGDNSLLRIPYYATKLFGQKHRILNNEF